MKASILGLFALMMSAQWSFAQQESVSPAGANSTGVEQEIIKLSKDKWQWMSDKNVDVLADLFHEKAVFVHMGGSWGTERELNIIKSGGIWYKKADIHEVSVNIIGTTAILLNRITLLAVVGGNEVTNPFMVTECMCSKTVLGSWVRCRSRSCLASSGAMNGKKQVVIT